MRHESFDPDVLGGAHDLGDSRRRLARSQPTHPAVDLKVVRSAVGLSRRQFVPGRYIVKAVDHGRQIVFEECAALRG